MNILVDIRPLMAGKISGVETYITNLLTQIFALDRKNQYFLWWNSHHDLSCHLPVFDYPNVNYIHTRLPNKILNLSCRFFNYPKLDQWIGNKLQIKIDKIFVPDPRPAPVSSACQKIITFHDLSFEHFKQTFSLKSRLWHRLVNPRREAQEATKIIAVSKATQDDLVHTYHLTPAKIKVIYEAAGLSIETLKPLKQQLIKQKYVLPAKFILALSTIEPRKNIEGLLKAFNRLNARPNFEHKLVIVGQSNEAIFAKVKILNQHSADVLFTGFVPEEDKPYFYALADAFVYPSFYEGFGLPLIEAMQMGCPVITSNCSSMPEIVGEAGILINPYEINSLQTALKRVLTDSTLRESLKNKGIKRARNFSWQQCAQETLALINT